MVGGNPVLALDPRAVQFSLLNRSVNNLKGTFTVETTPKDCSLHVYAVSSISMDLRQKSVKKPFMEQVLLFVDFFDWFESQPIRTIVSLLLYRFMSAVKDDITSRYSESLPAVKSRPEYLHLF